MLSQVAAWYLSLRLFIFQILGPYHFILFNELKKNHAVCFISTMIFSKYINTITKQNHSYLFFAQN